MIDTPPTQQDDNAPLPLNTMPSAEDYAEAAHRRRYWFFAFAVTLAVAVAGAFVAAGKDNIALPLALLIGVLTPILVWRYPRLALYVTFVAVCLFEMAQTPYADALTDRIPFFWNVNTIFQTYAHMNVKAVPVNLMEFFILTAGVCSVLRSVYSGTGRVRLGALIWPIAGYMAFVGLAWVNGILSGGDFKISLTEVRSQFYFLLAYLMAVNLIQERRQLGVLMWTMVICVGIKGILYTFRRYVTLAGQSLPDQGVGSHEEAFFFNAFVVLLLVLALCGVQKKLRYLMFALLPFVVLGNLATNRRAGTAALLLVIPIMLLAAYRALPERRLLIALVTLCIIGGFSIYYPVFRNSGSLLGQPARAIQSQFQPDPRDASSNAYRDAENADLMATIRLSPVQGYGYGKRMLHAVPIADISKTYEWWDIMTHNQILWVWMRVGSVGFFAFWMMISAIIIYACQMLQDIRVDNESKAVSLFAALIVCMLLIFGLLDLQLSNARDMLFTGFWIGTVAALPSLPRPALRTPPERRAL